MVGEEIFTVELDDRGQPEIQIFVADQDVNEWWEVIGDQELRLLLACKDYNDVEFNIKFGQVYAVWTRDPPWRSAGPYPIKDWKAQAAACLKAIELYEELLESAKRREEKDFKLTVGSGNTKKICTNCRVGSRVSATHVSCPLLRRALNLCDERDIIQASTPAPKDCPFRKSGRVILDW
jgi:hypothetical protein